MPLDEILGLKAGDITESNVIYFPEPLGKWSLIICSVKGTN